MFKYLILALFVSINASATDFGHIKDLYNKLNKETFSDEKWICNANKMEPKNYKFEPVPKQTYHCYNYTQEVSIGFYAKDMRVYKIEFIFNNTRSEKWSSTDRKNWAEIVNSKSLEDYAKRLFTKFSKDFIPPKHQSKLFSLLFNPRNMDSSFKDKDRSYSVFVVHPASYKNKISSHILTMKAN